MARRWLQVALALAVVTATATTPSSAQQMAASFPTMPTCPPAPLSLSPCIGYVFGVGSATLASCCSQLRGFLQAQAPCICAASKLTPSPIGVFLGQAQSMIPNVCDLPNPCDDQAAAGEGSTPPEAGTSPPSVAATPDANTPATEPSSGTPATADSGTLGAPPTPTEDASATAAAPAAGTGSKLPDLPHAAGAARSRDMAAGPVFVTVFLASVATMYV